ncbi:hypothetical protein NXS13_08170 [Corynebacterium sp. ES2730-CONJ]|uniref:hypothetical protein n=2 Tax=Corynebacterium TaxID=1716 RepID=UPI00216AC4CF|nr:MULTISPECIES: hypothetical protein [unclassified Corynebacterium]MCS4532472.1 hypothetical protein [Corynebacterium sp. ES2730-CONJ]
MKILKSANMLIAAALALSLGACAASEQQEPIKTQVAQAQETSAAPQFSAVDIPEKIVTDLTKPAEDPGLNIKVELQATGYNQQATGSVIYLLVTNTGDIALPPQELQVSLDGAELVPEGTIDLDLPLGAGASTNLQYAFAIDYYQLSQARLKVGNLVFEGNLNSV